MSEVKRIAPELIKITEQLKALMEYFSLKNKVLFDQKWTSGSVDVPGIGNYRAVDIYFWDAEISPVRCYVFDTIVRGGGMVSPVSSNGIHTDLQILLDRSGDTLTWSDVRLLHHNNASSHGTQYTSNAIFKIVGVEPVLPAALKEFSGGHCLTRLSTCFRWGGGILV